MSTKATKEALDLLAQHIEDCGPCDHPVNICVCGEKQLLADARGEVEAIEKAAVAFDTLEREGAVRWSTVLKPAQELMHAIAREAK